MCSIGKMHQRAPCRVKIFHTKKPRSRRAGRKLACMTDSWLNAVASRWFMKGRLAFHELAYPFDGNAKVKVVRTVEFGKVHANQVALGVDYRTAA